MCVCACRSPSEEREEGGGDGVREKDSPPVEVKEEERKEIFAARQRLSERVMTVLGEYLRGSYIIIRLCRDCNLTCSGLCKLLFSP